VVIQLASHLARNIDDIIGEPRSAGSTHARDGTRICLFLVIQDNGIPHKLLTPLLHQLARLKSATNMGWDPRARDGGLLRVQGKGSVPD
jgi:hypothetical protein